MKRYSMGLILLMLLLLAACGQAALTAQTPPEILYGEDVCDHCGMIISDERFAAALVIETGPNRLEHRIFDDIGDMFGYVDELNKAQAQGLEEGAKIVTYFVHDYHSLEWLDAREAYFVVSESVHSPMGSGMAAFAQAAEAEAQAQLWQPANVLDFETAQHESETTHSHAQH